jgi:hypothetical protein
LRLWLCNERHENALREVAIIGCRPAVVHGMGILVDASAAGRALLERRQRATGHYGARAAAEALPPVQQQQCCRRNNCRHVAASVQQQQQSRWRNNSSRAAGATTVVVVPQQQQQHCSWSNNSNQRSNNSAGREVSIAGWRTDVFHGMGNPSRCWCCYRGDVATVSERNTALRCSRSSSTAAGAAPRVLSA